ncbi:MAG TPA: hypothetical protein VFK54_04850 [Candidatus Limnocylindrales bacterium]|nr:hypothetical protein [Candidatus Limnocylindrales bacterium]
MTAAACGLGTAGSTSPSPSAAPSAPPSAIASPLPSEPAFPNGGQEVHPSSAPRAVGDGELITVFTHCGFEGRLDWAGSFWREVGRIPEGGAIGDPEDSGRITLVGPTRAVFESSTGTEVLLERLPGPAVLFPCD